MTFRRSWLSFGTSDEPEKPAYRAEQCEQCKGCGHPCPHVGREAAEYLGIPKGTLYMKLSDGASLPPSPANAIASTVTNLTSGWNPPGRIPCHCPMRN